MATPALSFQSGVNSTQPSCDVERAAIAVMGLDDAGLIHSKLRSLRLSSSDIATHLSAILERAKALTGAA